jgi:hypothetical protein
MFANTGTSKLVLPFLATKNTEVLSYVTSRLTRNATLHLQKLY